MRLAGHKVKWVVILCCLVLAVSTPALAVGQLTATLYVNVVDESGSPIESDSYAAVVALGSPWSRPVAEARKAPGDRMPVWKLPPGEYRIVCAAEGFGISFLDSFEVHAGIATKKRCRVPDLIAIEGQVLSAKSGEPIADARVGLIGAFGHDFQGELSPLGTALVQETLIAHSDQLGMVRVVGNAGTQATIWVEADTFAPLAITRVKFTKDSAPLGHLPLVPGGAGEARLTGIEEISLAHLRFELHPVLKHKSDLTASEVEARLQGIAMVWRRPPSEEGSAIWRSLPTGEWEVWLRRHDELLGEVPAILGRLSVRSGMIARLEAKMPPHLMRPPVLAQEPPVSLGLDLRLTKIEPSVSAYLRAYQWSDQRWIELPAHRRNEARQTRIHLERCPEDTTILLRSARWISTPVAVDQDLCRSGKVTEVKLFHSGQVSGQVLPPFGSTAPREGVLAVEFCPQDGDPLRFGELPVLVDEQGSWIARVPSGCLQPRFLADGFAQLRWKGIEVREDEDLFLGERSLSWATSFLVRVVFGEDGSAAIGADVALLSEEEMTTELRSLPGRHFRPEYQTIVNEEGWARLENLPPGVFVVRTLVKDALPIYTDSIELRQGIETVMPEIELPAPASLEVHLAEGLSLAGPEYRPSVHLAAASAQGWRYYGDLVSTIDKDGVVLFERVPPGRWQVSVDLATPSGSKKTLARQVVDLAPGGFETLEIESRVHRFHGRVVRRGEPLAAEIAFKPLQIDKGGQVFTTSSEEGDFEILLDAPGLYNAVVATEDGEIRAMVSRVVFENPEETVEVVIPEGTITGIVIGQEGFPIAGASVHARLARKVDQNELSSTTESGSNGRFSFDSLSAGLWQLTATKEMLGSELQDHELAADGYVGNVQLVLKEATTITGHISAGGRPVTGARGVFLPLGLDPRQLTTLPETVSDKNGDFSIEVDIAIRSGILLVEAPNLPTNTFVISAGGQNRLDLPLYGGLVRVLSGRESWAGLKINQLFLVREDGTGFFPTYLAEQSVFGTEFDPTWGASLGFSNLAPGTWSLVQVHTWDEMAALLSGGSDVPPVLQRFEVIPHQATLVEVDFGNAHEASP